MYPKLYAVTLLLIISGLLQSCDYWYDYKYDVTNYTGKTVTAVFVLQMHDSLVIDSIPAKTTKNILTTMGPLEGRKPLGLDINVVYKSMVFICNGDTSNHTYLEEKYWTYSAANTTYTATVAEGDF